MSFVLRFKTMHHSEQYPFVTLEPIESRFDSYAIYTACLDSAYFLEGSMMDTENPAKPVHFFCKPKNYSE